MQTHCPVAIEMSSLLTVRILSGNKSQAKVTIETQGINT